MEDAQGLQKFILKKLAARVGVPSEVLNRPKQGFSLPLGSWMRAELKDLVLTTLLDTQTLQRGYFNANGLRRMLDEHFQVARSLRTPVAAAHLRIVAPELSGKGWEGE